MRIAELQAFHVRIPFKRPFRHASYTRDSTDNVVVRCQLENGIVGFGEGVPREYVTGETIASAVDLLRRSDLRAQFEPSRDWPEAVAMAERLRLAPIAGDDRGCQGNGARCALEMAILDAYGRHFSQPLSTVVKLLAPELWSPREHVQYSSAITTSSTGAKIRLVSFGMRLYGFSQIKVKVGVAGQDDVARLRGIRSGGGWKIDLRIDANEAWPAAEAAQRILELKPFGITAVEQPIKHEEANWLPATRKQVAIPIMLDESLCGLVDAERAVAQGLCDLFNIRLSKCGGFIPSLRLVQFARRHGLGCQLGCQVGETAILSAAGRHFAASVKDLRYVEGSYDHHLVREALGTRDLTFRRGGWAKALTGPGLGIEIDSAALQRVTVDSYPLVFPIHWHKERPVTDATIEYFTATDGYCWRFRRYEPDGPPKATVVCLHGIQSHGGWYEYSSKQLCAAGFRVCYLDRRGSGINELARGDTPTFGRLLDDLSEFLQSPVPTGPVFLHAVSWGGKLAVALQHRHPQLVSGMVLLCPGFFPQVRVPLQTRLRILGTRLMAPTHLFPIPLNDPDLFTAVHRWRDFIRNDKLALRQATARFFVESIRLDIYLRRAAKSVTMPTLLLLAGQDRIIRNDLTHRFFQQFATADKNVITYAQSHHTLEFEPDPDRHLAEIINWMNRRCRG